MIQERVKSGLERARAEGKARGRPPIDPEKEEAIRVDLRAGRAGIVKLAVANGVGVGTVQRIKAALAGSKEGRRGNQLLRPCLTHWRR
jgi:DNA invertase Pin-like site-specific DNA recombinase